MIYRLDEDQQSEGYDSRIPSRQGCNSRRSGTFISDDEDDNDKGKDSLILESFFFFCYNLSKNYGKNYPEHLFFTKVDM